MITITLDNPEINDSYQHQNDAKVRLDYAGNIHYINKRKQGIIGLEFKVITRQQLENLLEFFNLARDREFIYTDYDGNTFSVKFHSPAIEYEVFDDCDCSAKVELLRVG